MKFWVLFLFILGCQRHDLEVRSLTSSKITAPATREQWTEKVLQKLRRGKGIRPTDPLNTWLKLSEDEFLDTILTTSEFEDTVLDMSLAFYGQKTENIRDPKKLGGNYHIQVFNVPLSLQATKAFFEQGDYFEKLTLLHAPVYLKPLDPLEPLDQIPGTPDEEARLKVIAKVHTYLDKILLAANNPQTTITEWCHLFSLGGEDTYFTFFYRLGLSSFTNEYFTEDRWVGKAYHVCNGKQVDNFNIASEAASLVEFTREILDYVPQLEKSVYQIKSIKDLKTMPDHIIDSKAWIDGIRVRTDIDLIPNTSTNMNRKRGAYILRQYFCDDLTPLNVSIPAEHTSGRHGSDASCFACHYKLDPMAGFFKDRGRYHRDFSTQQNILFADEALLNRLDYINQWRMIPGDTSTAWNIGYVRSSLNPSRNTYGESLEDLEKILQTAPEVKACFVRRTYEYYLGDSQAVSPALLEYLTQEFIKDTKAQNSAEAVKKLIKRILKGNTFKTVNRDSEACYDEAPRAATDSSLPCQIGSLIQKRCAICHSEQNTPGGLALNKLIQVGGEKVFRHIDKITGQQLSRKDSFGRILDRLNTTDVAIRMPLGAEIPDIERSRLYLWAQEEAVR